MSTDRDPYSRDHESVDLGKMLHEPRIPGDKPDGELFRDTSQSPLAQLRGGADPTNVGPGSVKVK